jgi:excisionase family DNA binding protein
MPLLSSVAQAAKASGISRSELYRRIAAGKLPVKQVGSKWRVRADDLRRMVEDLPTLGK